MSEGRSQFPAELQKDLIQLRETLHRYPELSSEEHETAARLEEALKKWHPKDLKQIAGTGIAARFAGKNPKAPVIAIRGDIDALPITEATGLPYQSERPGVMHACGHDVHAAWAVGAAALLSQNPAEGDVWIILQPAEEIAEGAKAILKSGILNGVSAIFGAHVDRHFELGKVVIQEGVIAASSDRFHIRITGQSCHGARPHEGKDTATALAAVIQGLNTIVSRNLNPSDTAVVSVGIIQAGTAYNIIPGTADIKGTIRAQTEPVRSHIHDRIRTVCQGIAVAYKVEINADIQIGTPPIINEKPAIDWARTAAEKIVGAASCVPLSAPNMGAEDFAYYLKDLPGAFIRIGGRKPGDPPIPAHSPQFYVEHGAIFIGAAILAETAREAARQLSKL